MARPRNTQTTQRQPAVTAPQSAPNVSPLSDEQVLLMSGWQGVAGDGDRVDLWSHPTKSSGNALPLEIALQFEQRSRDAAADADQPQAGREPSQEERDRAAFAAHHAAEETRLAAAREAERRMRQAELAAEEQAGTLVHDKVGRVSLWRCYACKFECRYSPDCDCETCAKITAAICCPRCGDTQPNMDPRRR